MSLIGNSLMGLVQIGTGDSETCLASRMETLRPEDCIPYKSKLVPDDPISQANEVYGAFKVETPTVHVPLRDGKLVRQSGSRRDRHKILKCLYNTPPT